LELSAFRKCRTRPSYNASGAFFGGGGRWGAGLATAFVEVRAVFVLIVLARRGNSALAAVGAFGVRRGEGQESNSWSSEVFGS